MLTQADKLGGDALRTTEDGTRSILQGHVAAHPRLIVTSARTQAGIAELRAEIAALASANPLG